RVDASWNTSNRNTKSWRRGTHHSREEWLECPCEFSRCTLKADVLVLCRAKLGSRNAPRLHSLSRKTSVGRGSNPEVEPYRCCDRSAWPRRRMNFQAISSALK